MSRPASAGAARTAPVRVAVVDVGTNSTRLLIADVDPASGALSELDRRSTVTRLGVGVDRSGRLSDEGMARVFAALDEYRAAIDAADVAARPAVLTSAVRDADNGADFTRRVREDYGLDARTIEGDEEARLSYLGATSGRAPGDGALVVLDIGGGSTELIVGEGSELPSTSRRRPESCARASVTSITIRRSRRGRRGRRGGPRSVPRVACPAELRERARQMVAVAGTATSVAAIDQRLEPYRSELVHGYVVSLAACEAIRDRLAALDDAQRRAVAGLHPDRAPTIVAGCAFLVEAAKAFELDRVEVSEHDILHGVAIETASVV